MDVSETDLHYMRKALQLARKGRGWTSPNPMVGAVLVKGERIVGRGWHPALGAPHAEVKAIEDAGEAARGATLYVTLEPCNHQGRTPPCTRAVLAAGIARVVIGMADPNPGVSGGGADFLESRGLDVVLGVLGAECRRLNQPFIKYVTTGLPYLVLKAAATLDGRIAARSGDARWITNERSRRLVHRLRHELDAVLVGIGTVLADDPQLTVRLDRGRFRQPVRIVLDSRLQLPPESRLAVSAREVPVWVVCGETVDGGKRRRLETLGVEVIPVVGGQRGIDPLALVGELGRRGITSVLIEGGARVFGSFIDARLMDEGYFFYAPKILGDARGVPMIAGSERATMAEALPLHDLRVRRFGEDVLLLARFREQLY